MTAPSRPWRRAAGVVAAGLAGLLALGACSVTTSQDSTAPAGRVGEDSAAGDVGGGVTGAPAAPPEDNGDPQQAPVEPQQRSLIYTASMSVRVDDVVAAADRASDIAVGSGGLVAEDRRSLDADRSEARLTFRVPADKFTTVLDELARLGEEETRSIQTQDVTEALVDLEARLATQEASVARVRALLARAQTIGEIVSIESELTRRTADLDSLKQRQARLAGLVALSTITVNLRGPEAPELTEPESGFLAGLKSGWRAFLESVEVVLTVAGFLVPWMIVIGAPLWLVIWLLRRRRPRPGAPVAPVGPIAPVTPASPVGAPE